MSNFNPTEREGQTYVLAMLSLGAQRFEVVLVGVLVVLV